MINPSMSTGVRKKVALNVERQVAQEAVQTPEPSTAESWDKIGQIHE